MSENGKLSSEALYLQLGRLVETMPDLVAEEKPSSEVLQWLGRAVALVSAVGDMADVVMFKSAVGMLDKMYHKYSAAHDIAAIVHRALAVAELHAPSTSQGAFIPAGNSFDALGAVAKVFDGATVDLLIIDPYMDQKFMTDFAALAREKVCLRLLATKKSGPALRVAVQCWQDQYGSTRPLTAKLAKPDSLHDRVIISDRKTVWVLTQSFNGLAARAPASIVRTDDETAALKVAAY